MEKERQNVSYGFLMVENLQQTIESSSPLRILSHQGYTSVSPIPSANPKFRKLSLFSRFQTVSLVSSTIASTRDSSHRPNPWLPPIPLGSASSDRFIRLAPLAKEESRDSRHGKPYYRLLLLDYCIRGCVSTSRWV
jgi:hypothetical protein